MISFQLVDNIKGYKKIATKLIAFFLGCYDSYYSEVTKLSMYTVCDRHIDLSSDL